MCVCVFVFVWPPKTDLDVHIGFPLKHTQTGMPPRKNQATHLSVCVMPILLGGRKGAVSELPIGVLVRDLVEFRGPKKLVISRE